VPARPTETSIASDHAGRDVPVRRRSRRSAPRPAGGMREPHFFRFMLEHRERIGCTVSCTGNDERSAQVLATVSMSTRGRANRASPAGFRHLLRPVRPSPALGRTFGDAPLELLQAGAANGHSRSRSRLPIKAAARLQVMVHQSGGAARALRARGRAAAEIRHQHLDAGGGESSRTVQLH